MLFLLGGVECYFIIVYFDSLFFDALVYLFRLVNRAICCCVSELLFSFPAGYLNPCAFSLSAGISFQSGLL
jgi:hypothetical protein